VNKTQFRAVTLYGLTNWHDAIDAHIGFSQPTVGGTIDSEVEYYLKETFNPWDLYAAVEKQEYSNLYLPPALTSATTNIVLTNGIDDDLYYDPGSSAPGGTWINYTISPEIWANGAAVVNSRWVNEFQYGTDYKAYSKNWALDLNGNGADQNYEMLMITPTTGNPTSTSPLTLQLKDLVDFGFWYKALGSSGLGPYIDIKVCATANPDTSLTNYAEIQARSDNWVSDLGAGWHRYTLNNIEDFIHTYTSDSAFQIADTQGTGLPVGQFHSFEYWTSKLGDYYVAYVGVLITPENRALVDDLSVAYLNSESGIRYERVYNMEEDKLIPSDWNNYCTFPERVLVDGTLIRRHGYLVSGQPHYDIDYVSGNITFYTGTAVDPWTLPVGTNIKVLYNTIEENDKGRYEWVTVGRDADTVDSVASALVAESFDSTKDIDIGIAGTDMFGAIYQYQIPNVMSKNAWAGGSFPTAVGTNADYKDVPGTTTNYVGYRAHLADDWCTKWSVASSNMIGVGGPRANLLAYYGNDWTDALFGNEFAASPYASASGVYAEKITGVSCWNRGWSGTWNVYSSTETTGYAVISTTKDINGTVLFLVYGYDGRDTFYGAQWLKGDEAMGRIPGIHELQSAPCGLTSIILKIDYTDPKHPTFTIPECLGTITEARWIDPYTDHNDVTSLNKGGIHDP